MEITHVTLKTDKLTHSVKIAVVADLHDRYDQTIIRAIEKNAPDLVAVPGDLLHNENSQKNGLEFLSWSAERYATFVSLGNHEWKCHGDIRAKLKETGANLLDNDFLPFGELVVGGLSSGYEGKRQGRFKRTPDPDTAWLDGFCVQKGFKLLLCHHPEYYQRHLKERAVDLTIAGHAHGGQWRFFGIPVFSPGQGILPRYTNGLYHGRLLVSRGLANRAKIPRIFNPTQLIILTLAPKENGVVKP